MAVTVHMLALGFYDVTFTFTVSEVTTHVSDEPTASSARSGYAGSRFLRNFDL
jgi:hypothetical protein